MFCPQCGREFKEKVNFCCQCGSAMFTPGVSRKKLHRSRERKIAGVCGGLAEYVDIDPTLMRLIWVMLALFAGWGVIGYVIGWIIMPEEPARQAAPAAAPAVSPSSSSIS